MNEEEFVEFYNNMDNIINKSDKNKIDLMIIKKRAILDYALKSQKKGIFESEESFSRKKAKLFFETLITPFSAVLHLNGMYKDAHSACLYANDQFFYYNRELCSFDEAGRETIYYSLFYFFKLFYTFREELNDFGIYKIESELQDVGFPKFKLDIDKFGNTILFY
ncbi:hypothetical protein [Lutibacter sp.]|uniref:hypothetical protein n=1 Tax=Lutibacter sp. TaxID=1925666 RepID=UPI003565F12D